MKGMFEDRVDAGQQLAQALVHPKSDNDNIVVYALPRGGVVVGAEVARALGAPLEVLIARKLGHPSWEEYAIGAVTETGRPVWNEAEHEMLDQTAEKQIVSKGRQEAKRRRQAYTGQRQPISARGKTAIIVDDGIATGLTMRAAIEEIRAQKPNKIIVAVPVGPDDALDELQEYTDEIVVLNRVPTGSFGAVGAFYRRFEQTGDNEVQNIMAEFYNE